jgi:hypothetical protein
MARTERRGYDYAAERWTDSRPDRSCRYACCNGKVQRRWFEKGPKRLGRRAHLLREVADDA